MSGLSNAQKKLLKNFRDLQKEKDLDGMTAAPDADNIFHWRAVIFGPKDTIWEDGIFELEMNFKDDFPDTAPDVKFVTPVYHPNVYRNGNICLDILQDKWSRACDISSILNSIRSLFDDPNPKSPANAEAAQDFTDNKPKYNEKVKQCVQQSIKLWQEKHPETK